MEQIFRVGSNISEKFVLGGTNFRGFQIKCDIYIANVWQYSLVYKPGILATDM